MIGCDTTGVFIMSYQTVQEESSCSFLFKFIFKKFPEMSRGKDEGYSLKSQVAEYGQYVTEKSYPT